MMEPEHYRVNDFCRLHSIGRSKFYELVQAGRIRVVKLDGRTLVPRQALPTFTPTRQTRIEANKGGSPRTSANENTAGNQ